MTGGHSGRLLAIKGHMIVAVCSEMLIIRFDYVSPTLHYVNNASDTPVVRCHTPAIRFHTLSYEVM